MSRAKPASDKQKRTGSTMKVVKVRMEQDLVDQLDAVVGEASRAELIRDLVAHRLTPHPALTATHSVHRLCCRLEKRCGMDANPFNRYDGNSEQLEALRADIRELAAAVNKLQSTMARELLKSSRLGSGRT